MKDNLNASLFMVDKGVAQQKFDDHRTISIWMTILTALAGTFLWTWDYIHDPMGAAETIWLRLAVIPTALPYLLCLVFHANRNIAFAAAVVSFAGWEYGFLHILPHIKMGNIYGLAGFIYFINMPLLMTRGLSLPQNLSIVIWLVVFPLYYAKLGFYTDFLSDKYAALLFPAGILSSFGLYFYEQSYHSHLYYRKRLEASVYTDPLTGVGNRRLFIDRLEAILSNPIAPNSSYAILLLDLDRFKKVNDEYGHLAGDELLCQVCDRLLSLTGDQDVFARIGGDEFALIVTGVSSERQMAERVAQIKSLVEKPFQLSLCEVSIGISIGVHMIDVSDRNVQNIIGHADVSMYRDKQNARRLQSREKHMGSIPAKGPNAT